ncbi:forkhead box protein I3-like [Canis lupus dingo]|uniref:forkhead box protein I3-like n=1 Tax=Canis lupus dingo TaxID=286419 RepID=UPI000DC6B570|nr:forkhead box protein I3-like [Canis lupus dingo]
MPGALGRHLLSSVAAGEGPRRVRPVGACSPQAGAPGREPGGRALPTCRADQGHEVKAFAARPSLGSRLPASASAPTGQRSARGAGQAGAHPAGARPRGRASSRESSWPRGHSPVAVAPPALPAGPAAPGNS